MVHGFHGYLKRMTKKYEKGKIKFENYKLVVDFVNQRTKDNEEKFKKYNNLTPIEQYKYREKLKNLRDDLWINFKKIADGRIASMGLHKTVKNPENIEDISTDAVLTVFKYINRYDSARSSSAFAYVTQEAYHSIVASLNAINLREKTYITGLDFFENINTIDNPLAAFTATNKFINGAE